MNHYQTKKQKAKLGTRKETKYEAIKKKIMKIIVLTNKIENIKTTQYMNLTVGSLKRWAKLANLLSDKKKKKKEGGTNN